MADAPLTLGAYAVHIAREGFASIVHRASGEIMHSRTPPLEEAQRVYVEQSRLAERLRRAACAAPAHGPEGVACAVPAHGPEGVACAVPAHGPEGVACAVPAHRPRGPRTLHDEALVLWDVGLGAAANAMAAIRCHEGNATGPARALHIVSFENDLDPLRLALANDERFPYLQHAAPHGLLRDGRWEGGGVRWELREGDFLDHIAAAPAPEVIFYDMFSPKTCGPAWRLATFRRLFDRCAPDATLCTYTLSTAARAMMLAAGFWVARGRAAGAKAETSVALTPCAAQEGAHVLLGAEWLAKWERSAAKFPADVPPEEHAVFERTIRAHPQFAR